MSILFATYFWLERVLRKKMKSIVLLILCAALSIRTVIAYCGYPGKPFAGGFVNNDDLTRKLFPDGYKVQYKCTDSDKEHKLVPKGGQERTCQKGQWTGNFVPKCLKDLSVNKVDIQQVISNQSSDYSPFSLTFKGKPGGNVVKIVLSKAVSIQLVDIVLDSPTEDELNGLPIISLSGSRLKCQSIASIRQLITIPPDAELNIIRRLIAKQASADFPYEYQHYVRIWTFSCWPDAGNDVSNDQQVFSRTFETVLFLNFTHTSTLCNINLYQYEGKSCNDLEIPLNVNIGTSGELNCAAGFQSHYQSTAPSISNDVELTRSKPVCYHNGSWSYTAPDCSPTITCPLQFNQSIFSIELTYATYFNHLITAIPGTQATFICREHGSLLTGNQTLDCDLNGTWSSKEPECISVNPTGRRLTLFHGVIFAVMMVLMVLAITVYFAYRIRINNLKERNGRKRSNHDADDNDAHNHHYSRPTSTEAYTQISPSKDFDNDDMDYSTVHEYSTVRFADQDYGDRGKDVDSHKSTYTNPRYTRGNSFRLGLQTLPEEDTYDDISVHQTYSCIQKTNYRQNISNTEVKFPYVDEEPLYADVITQRRPRSNDNYDEVAQKDELYVRISDERNRK